MEMKNKCGGGCKVVRDVISIQYITVHYKILSYLYIFSVSPKKRGIYES